MTWNYRVMRRSEGGETFDGIYEVYYDNDNNVTGWTTDPVAPICSQDDEYTFKEILEQYITACDKPILDWESGKEITHD